jgi:hypothetical protein
MIDFSIELAAERIVDYRTRKYFSEVFGTYSAGYYRSAVVMLWSIVVADKRDDIKLMKRLTIFASLLLSSCAIGDFTPYSGQQQNWPTQPGAFVSTKYVIPVYIHSYPDRPYIVLGYLDATTAPIRNWVGGPVAFAAQRAKELRADAIIVIQQGQQYAGTDIHGKVDAYGHFHGSSDAVFLGKAQVFAIKWK